MKTFIGIVFFLCFFAGSAVAHPVDRERKDICGITDQSYKDAWVHFWHCKRELEDLTIDYAGCVGEVQALRRLLSWPEYAGNQDVLTYFDVAPADPITENLGDFEAAAAHLQACEDTFKIFTAERGMCEYYRVEAVSALFSELNAPPTVLCCDKKRRNCKPC